MTSIVKRSVAEFIGTFWLVFAGTGSAIIASIFLSQPGNIQIGIGLLGVSIAFGLTVLTMAYTIGHISGCHINPAVTLGLWAGKRFPGKDVPWYMAAQFLGGLLGSALLYFLLADSPMLKNSVGSGFAANGFGTLSPGKFGLTSVIIVEVVMTFIFVFVIMGVTRGDAPVGFAGLAIGLALTLIHLVSIPVDNCSVNPARSLAPALFAGGAYLSQVWVFLVFPIVGGLLGGLAFRLIFGEAQPRPDIVGD